MTTPWAYVVSAMVGDLLARKPAFDRTQLHPAPWALGRTWRAVALRTMRCSRYGAMLGLAVLCRADAAERPGKRLPAAPLVFRFIDPSKTAGSLIRQRGGAAPQPLRGA